MFKKRIPVFLELLLLTKIIFHVADLALKTKRGIDLLIQDVFLEIRLLAESISVFAPVYL